MPLSHAAEEESFSHATDISGVEHVSELAGSQTDFVPQNASKALYRVLRRQHRLPATVCIQFSAGHKTSIVAVCFFVADQFVQMQAKLPRSYIGVVHVMPFTG